MAHACDDGIYLITIDGAVDHQVVSFTHEWQVVLQSFQVLPMVHVQRVHVMKFAWFFSLMKSTMDMSLIVVSDNE